MEVDYYHLLGVRTDATKREIRIAYRRMAEVYHPDKLRELPGNLKREGEDIMRLLNEAKSVLLNPDRRKEYDSKMGISDSKEPAIILQEEQPNIDEGSEVYVVWEKERMASKMSRVMTSLGEMFKKDPEYQQKIAMAQEMFEAEVIEEPEGAVENREPEEVEMKLEFSRIETKENNSKGQKERGKKFKIVAIEEEEEEEAKEVEWEEE